MSLTATSSISFVTLDYRGREGFPTGPKGLVYHHVSPLFGRERDFYVRIDATTDMWRIDHREFGMNVAVYGPNGEAYFETEAEAGSALAAYLNQQANKRVC